MRIRAFFFGLLILSGCSIVNNQTSVTSVSAVNLGKKITIEGWAVNCKTGAQLIGTDFDLWIDGLSSWPEGYYTGGEKGKRLRVVGILTEDNGVPVFIPKSDEPIVQGIPVLEGTDLRKASHRYILKDANWELIRK